MEAGKLNRQIQIQYLSITKTENGHTVETWVTKKTVWAEVIMSGGREFYAAQRLNAETNAVFRIRYNQLITPRQRIMHGGRIFEILAAIDPDGKRVEMQLYAKEVR